MSQHELVLNLSSLRLTIRFENAELAYLTLRQVWQRASDVAFTPIRHHAEYQVRPEGGRFRLRVDGGHVRYAEIVEDVAPLLEGALYTDLLRTQLEDGFTVLHASSCVWQGRPLVFAGVSGAGKSALVRGCVELGCTYLGDEHIITDGERIWGLPRAIHMDVHREGAPSLPWHQGADLSSYRCRNAAGDWFRLPMVPLAAEQVALSAADARKAVLVAASRSDSDTLAPMNAAQRLRTLEGAHFVAGRGLRSLAVAPTAYTLTWCHPGRALHQLLSQLK